MPAPIAKGHYPYQPSSHNSHKTNNPAGKPGVIIVAAVLIAAGYAVYENREHVKEFMDRSRRKITMAVQNFHDEYMTPEDERRRRRNSAGEEELEERPPPLPRRPTERSMPGDYDEKAEATGRDNWPGDSVYRHRSVHQNRSAMHDDDEPVRNPFTDENKVLYDTKRSSNLIAPSESSATLSADDYLDEKPLREIQRSVDTGYHAPSEKPGSTMPELLFSADALDAVHRSPPVAPAAPPSLPEVAAAAPIAPVVVPAVPPPPPAVAPPVPASVPAPAVQSPAESRDMEQSNPDIITQNYQQSQQFWSINEWSHDVADAEDDRSDARSQSSLGNDISIIGSEVDEDEDDRIEAASDLASSVAGSWSEVGSEISAEELRRH